MFLKTPITMIATYFGRIKTPMRRTGNKSSNTVPIGRRTYKANKKRAKQIVSSDCSEQEDARYTISCADFTKEITASQTCKMKFFHSSKRNCLKRLAMAERKRKIDPKVRTSFPSCIQQTKAELR